MVRCVIRSAGLCVPLLLLFALSAAGQQVRLPSNQQLRANGLELGWYTQISMDPLRDSVRDVAFDGKVLYVQTSRGVIQAISTDAAEPESAAASAPASAPASGAASAATPSRGGQTVWITQVGTPDLPSFRPATNSREVFVVTGSQLYALDKQTGRHTWRARLPGAPSAPLAASDEYAYVGFIDGQLRAYDLRGPTQSWFYRTGETISVPALPLAGLVAFASQDGILYVSNAGARSIVFEFETDYPVSADLALRGDLIYLASQDFDVYCINSRTGLLVWRRSLGEPITRPLVVVEDEIYATPDAGGLHSLNALTGRRRWWDREVTGFIAASPTRVYASDRVGRLVILDRATGRRTGIFDLTAFPRRFINSRNDRLFLTSRDGLLICLHEQSLRQPAFHTSATAPTSEPPAEPAAEQKPADGK
jgi:outer membrane protein assembly factor BamB